MKKIIVAAIASTLLLASVAEAQQWREPPREDRHYREHRQDARKHIERQRWMRGQRMSDWRRHQEIRDYRRYGLHRPGHGERWVRVGNDYLLISVATGIIAGLVMGAR